MKRKIKLSRVVALAAMILVAVFTIVYCTMETAPLATKFWQVCCSIAIIVVLYNTTMMADFK